MLIKITAFINFYWGIYKKLVLKTSQNKINLNHFKIINFLQIKKILMLKIHQEISILLELEFSKIHYQPLNISNYLQNKEIQEARIIQDFGMRMDKKIS